MPGPTMWVVERSGSEVFLFGETVGVGRDDAWFTDAIHSAVVGCHDFWCEIADADEIVRSPSLATHGFSDRPLSSRLNRSDLRHVNETARSIGVESGTLKGLRPWLAGQLLEQAHRTYASLDAHAGVHEVLVQLAKEAGKVVRAEYPDPDALLSAFGNLDDAVEIEYLMWTVDRAAQRGGEIDRQVAAWMAGDSSVVEEQISELRTKYPSLYEWLLVDRNRAWVPRIDAMLEHPGSVFVLVGDAHLPGADGVLNLLAHSGLEPRRAT